MAQDDKHVVALPDQLNEDSSNNDPRLVRAAILLSRMEQLKKFYHDSGEPAELIEAQEIIKNGLQSETLRWIELREAERLIIDCVPPEQILPYLDRANVELVEIRNHHIFAEELEEYYKEKLHAIKEKAEDQGNLEFDNRLMSGFRFTLNRLTEDLHTAYSMKHRKRRIIIDIRERKVQMFIYAFIAFLAVMILFTFILISQNRGSFLGWDPGGLFGRGMTFMLYPIVACSSGWFGAAFSILQVQLRLWQVWNRC